MSGLTSARHLARRTAQPFDHWNANVLGGLATVGVTGQLVVLGNLQAALTLLFFVTTLALGLVAYDLQREADERTVPRFTIAAIPVEAPDPALNIEFASRRWYNLRTIVIDVRNDGPTARFVARIDHVTGANRLEVDEPIDAVAYRVEQVAWVNTIEPTYEIARGHASTLRIASGGKWKAAGSGTGTALWFWQATSETYNPNRHGGGWRMRPVDDDIAFDLTVTNLDADTAVTEGFVIDLDDNGEIANFRKA